jgi:peptide methionine sulfoxide reductase msrA/msrB
MKSPEHELKPRLLPPGTLAIAAMVAIAVILAARWSQSAPRANDPTGGRVMSHQKYTKPSNAELKKTLSGVQYEVTQNAGTEPPFDNAYWNNHQAGLYVDIATGEPLFSSTDKFESGTGWPSFTRPVETDRVVENSDGSHGMSRQEVRSVGGASHLGHVFDDGPAPTHLRYCINSASLRFIPVAKLEAEGYGAYAPLFGMSAPTPATAKTAPAAPSSAAPAPNTCTRPAPGGKPGCSPTLETAILAGGCFWGMEDILRQIPGVIETEVGYTGGTTSHPTYEDVHTGRTGHAESVRIVFDPKKVSYDDLLEKWFFKMHDPTTRDSQGNDRGSQYRSAIFVTSPEQRKVAEMARDHAQKSGLWKKPIVTQIVDAGPFTPAEAYHQKYLEKNPGGYTCHYVRN